MGAPPGREKRSKAGGRIAIVALLVAALVLVRMLGPGGRPSERDRGPAPPVAGHVLREDDTPVPSAVVEAEFDTGGHKRGILVLKSPPADAAGKFVVAGAPEKWTSLRVRVKRGPLSIDLDLGDTPGPLDLSLRLPPTFTLAGIVVSSEMRRPLPDMTVRFGGQEARTDQLGRFSIPDLPGSMADRQPPVLEISGKGRQALRRPISWEDSVDDLLLSLDREGP